MVGVGRRSASMFASSSSHAPSPRARGARALLQVVGGPGARPPVPSLMNLNLHTLSPFSISISIYPFLAISSISAIDKRSRSVQKQRRALGVVLNIERQSNKKKKKSGKKAESEKATATNNTKILKRRSKGGTKRRRRRPQKRPRLKEGALPVAASGGQFAARDRRRRRHRRRQASPLHTGSDRGDPPTKVITRSWHRRPMMEEQPWRPPSGPFLLR